MPGMDLIVQFGGFDDSVDKSVLCLYGDESHPGAGWGMEAVGSPYPEDANLAPHQKISMYFEMADYLPYGEVSILANNVVKHLEGKGWSSAPEVESIFGPSANTIENMVDAEGEGLSAHKKLGTGCYEKYPEVPGLGGRWAARGFFVKVERPENKPEFSDNEVAEAVHLHAEAMEIVFGKKLEEATL